MDSIYATSHPLAYLSERYGHPDGWVCDDVKIIERSYEPQGLRFVAEVPPGPGRVITIRSSKQEEIIELWVDASRSTKKRVLCISE